MTSNTSEEITAFENTDEVTPRVSNPDEYSHELITCARCGSNLSKEERFCHNCGLAVKQKKIDSSLDCGTKNRTSRKKFITAIIKNSLLLAMAVFMLISVFLPLTSISSGDTTRFDVELNYSSIDGIEAAINSYYSLDADEMEDEAEELEDAAADYVDEWADDEEPNQLESFIKDFLMLALRSEDVEVSVGKISMLVLSIAQILLAIAFLVFAILNFISLFTRMKSFSKLSFSLLLLNSIVIFTNAFIFKHEFASIKLGDRFYALEGGITAIPVLMLILAICISITFLVLRLAVDKEKFKVGNIIKNSLVLIFALVILISAFAPIVNTSVKAEFSGTDSKKRATSSLDSSVFYSFNITEDEKEEIEDKLNSKLFWYDEARHIFSSLENCKKYEFEKGKGDAKSVNQNMFSWLLLGYDAYEYAGIFSLGGTVMTGIVACALLLIFITLYELAMGVKINLAISYTLKSVVILLTLMILILAIVMSVVVTSYADTVYNINYSSSIAYGPVLMFIFAIAVICVPPIKSKKELSEFSNCSQPY